MPSDMRASLGLSLAALVPFLLWPEIDLYVSGLFHDPATGFPISDWTALNAIRDMTWDLNIALLVVAIAAFAYTRLRGPILGISDRIWAFVAVLYLLGPGLLANGLLKTFWGRARPDHVRDFGGEAPFTPAYLPSGNCDLNCSFVSGEASASVVLVLSTALIAASVRPRLPRAGRVALVGAAVALCLATCFHRLAAGRHFLSDIVFGGVMMLWLAYALAGVMLAPRRTDP